MFIKITSGARISDLLVIPDHTKLNLSVSACLLVEFYTVIGGVRFAFPNIRLSKGWVKNLERENSRSTNCYFSSESTDDQLLGVVYKGY